MSVLRSYTMVKYLPPGIAVDGRRTDDSAQTPDTLVQLSEEFVPAQLTLGRYVADLEQRFVPGGFFDTSCITSGETFIEVVSGHPFSGLQLCRCLSPLLAVQLFCDAVERYVVGGRERGTLYWRVFPELMQTVPGHETLYSVYARLLIL